MELTFTTFVYLLLFVGGPLAFFVYRYSQKKPVRATRKNRVLHHYKAADQSDLDRGMAALQKRDPEFDFTSFARRAGRTFTKIRDGWSRGALEEVRNYMSDGVFERLSILLETNELRGLRNVNSEVQVLNVEAVSIQSDRYFDTIKLRIEARLRDQYLSTEDGRVIAGDQAPADVAEYWSFLRRRGVQSRTNDDEDACPNCSAPVEINDQGRCGYCQAPLTSGEHDWVLAEISQVSAGATFGRPVPGLDDLLERDPAFNVQYIEDRVSVMFWHMRAAETFGDIRYLKNLANRGLLNRVESGFSKGPNGERTFVADCAVGSVTVHKIVPAQDSSDWDRVHVAVKWSGHEETRPLPDFLPPQVHLSQLYTEEFVLARSATAVTPQQQGLTSFHCNGCGAAVAKLGTGSCDYCDAPLNDGSHDWVLEAVQPVSSGGRAPQRKAG